MLTIDKSKFFFTFKGITSGSKGFSKSYKFPASTCIKENEPDFYTNVGAYANDIWKIIKKDGGVECQTQVKVWVENENSNWIQM